MSSKSLSLPFHLPNLIVDSVELPHCSCLGALGELKVLAEAAAVAGIAPYPGALNAEAPGMCLSRAAQRSQAGNGWGDRWWREVMPPE